MAKADHVIHSGDKHELHVADVMKGGSGNKAALFIADPPYNFGLDYGRGKKADKLTDDDYYNWTRDWLTVGVNRLRAGGAAFVICPDEWAAEIAFLLRWRLKLERRNWIKWHETFGTQQEQKFARCSRHVLYFVKPGGTPIFTPDRVPSARQEKYKDSRANPDGKVPGDVWEISRVCGTFKEKVRIPGIPTQLPEELLRRIVRAASRPGDRVLEFFAGSGSCGRVCVTEERYYEGYESNVKTASVAARRIRDASRDRPTAQAGG